MLTRVGAALLALAVLTGCANALDGSPRPKPTDPAALESALLTPDEMDSVLGISGVDVISEADQLADTGDQLSDPNCVGAMFTAEVTVYPAGRTSAAVFQDLTDSEYDATYWVEQSAVLFKTAEDAREFLNDSKTQWADCIGKSVVFTDEEGDYEWVFDGVAADGVSLGQTVRGADGDGWGCRHVLRISADVAAEAKVCGMDLDGEAADIAEQIVAKLG